MRVSILFVPILLLWVMLINGSYQLQAFESQVLFLLRKHLEFPPVLKSWEYYYGDLCYIASTPQMSIKCQNNSVSELRIMGDKLAKVSGFNGFSVSNKTLSDKFSMDSFVTTLTRLSSLKSLSLVSLGIWGSIPDKIHRLSSLEMLDLSSNFVYGSVPPQMSRLMKLQSLRLDNNFFNDTVPNWFNSLSNLTVLSMKNNKLKGQIPSNVCKIVKLTDLSLSHNKLSGKIPDLSTLKSLHVLDLRENHFDSELPALPKQLVTALLSRNSLIGEIPMKFGKLDRLQHLDLSFNLLTRTPPSVLFALPKISYLELSSNHFSGSLSNDLRCGSELGFVDISNNKFIGELPSCLVNMSNERVVNFGGNCLSIKNTYQHHESFCKSSHKKVKLSSRSDIGILVGVVGGAIVVLLLFVFGVVILCKRYRSRRASEQYMFPKVAQDNARAGVTAELVTNARFISQSMKFGAQGTSLFRLFYIEELKEATNNFDKFSLLGEGSIGKIYQGRLQNGTYVAIRSLTSLKRYAVKNLKCQLEFLSKLHHSHLVSILGHCIDDGGPDDLYVKRVFLVYEYVPGGNYRTHLSENRPEKALKWSDRLSILIGVAKAVHFLHTGVIPGYFNNQLKTHNILLDEHHVGKLSDYGMSIFKEENEKQELKGDFLESRQMTNLDNDVYNFGFILLESLVGPIVTGKGEAYLLNEMASFGSQDGRKQIVDPAVLISCSQESLSIVVSITNKCISPELSARPSFEDVLWNLQYAAQVQATADADLKSECAPQPQGYMT